MQRQTALEALGEELKKQAQGKERPKSRQVLRAKARHAGKARPDLVEDPDADRPPNRAKRRAGAARERKNPARVKRALKKRAQARKER
jgi:hypothetical protein